MNPDHRDVSLSFLHEHATTANRALTTEEKATLQYIQQLLHTADKILLFLGGKAGRLGESIVGTALLEGTLQALNACGKAGTPITIFVDAGVAELFDATLYQHIYWSTISIMPCTQPPQLEDTTRYRETGKHILLLDFHGAHDGMPFLRIDTSTPTQTSEQVTTLGHLFRVGVRSFAVRGQERRYADFIETLFALADGTLASEQAQPHIRLSPEDIARDRQLIKQFKLNPQAVRIICFFQSVVPAKCYELWDEVLQPLSTYFAQHDPQQKLDFFVACGPDESLPEGIRKADMIKWLQDFTGVNANATVHIAITPSLRDLAILTAKADLALANDTGPAHIAGAVHTPTIVVFLPGTIYSQQVWSSTLFHHGVTLDPNPFSYSQIEAAILWGKTHIIDSIPPQRVYEEIIRHLPEKL